MAWEFTGQGGSLVKYALGGIMGNVGYSIFGAWPILGIKSLML